MNIFTIRLQPTLVTYSVNACIRKYDVARAVSVVDQYNYTVRELAAVHTDERDRRLDYRLLFLHVHQASSASGGGVARFSFRFAMRKTIRLDQPPNGKRRLWRRTAVMYLHVTHVRLNCIAVWRYATQLYLAFVLSTHRPFQRFLFRVSGRRRDKKSAIWVKLYFEHCTLFLVHMYVGACIW